MRWIATKPWRVSALRKTQITGCPFLDPGPHSAGIDRVLQAVPGLPGGWETEPGPQISAEEGEVIRGIKAESGLLEALIDFVEEQGEA
jgi:hypothetical protein